MRRALHCLPMLLVTIACGDSAPRAREADAGASAAAEAGHVAPLADGGEQPKERLGAACEIAEDDCGGDDAICLMDLTVAGQRVEFVGGYCSRACEGSDACGPLGDCPVAATRAELGGSPLAVLFAELPSNCLRRCSAESDCRSEEGYACRPMLSAMPEQLRALAGSVLADKPIASETFCVPSSRDAGP